MPKIVKAVEIFDAMIRFVSLVDKAANKKQFLITKAEDGNAQFSTYGRIVKADAETHYVTGVVYEPLKEDTDGNFMTEDEIRKAAHWFAKNGDQVDVQHSFEAEGGVTVVETYIAPTDMTIDDELVIKGTWLMTVEITDPAIWEAVVKGEITGFSMGGVGKYGKEDIDLEKELTKGAPETPAATPTPGTCEGYPAVAEPTEAEVKENKGIAKRMLSMLGFDFEVVEKGEVMDNFNESIRNSAFWNAWYALEDVLHRYSWSKDKYVFESDEDVIREALADFNTIITNLLTTQEIAKSLAAAIPVEKAGKKISSANKKKLDEACQILTDLCESFNDDAEEEIEKEDSNIMTPEEIKKMVAETVAEEIAKANQSADGEAADPENPAPEALTKESVQTMIEDSIKKAFAEMPEAQTAETELEGEEPVTKEAIGEMITAAIEPILKARGIPSNLNDEQKPVEKGEADVFDGFFV